MWTLYFCPVICLLFLFLASPNLSGRRLDVCHTSTHDVALGPIQNACLKCAACGSLEIQDAKNRHQRTIAQICRAISSQLMHVIDNRKKLVKQQHLPHMPLQYGELWHTNGLNQLASLGHSSKFQRVSRLGSVAARHSTSGRQPNFAALNRGRQLYSEGRPSRWSLAYISSVSYGSKLRR